MRKSKFDQSPLPVQDSKYMNQDDNISEIENRVEFDTEFVNLTNQIEDIKAAIQELEQIKACVDSSMDKSILAEYRHKLIEEEKCLFEKQMAELKATHEKHWKEVNRFAKSYTSFSLNGWIAKISVIGFWILYAYFCLTLGGWIIYSMCV